MSLMPLDITELANPEYLIELAERFEDTGQRTEAKLLRECAARWRSAASQQKLEITAPVPHALRTLGFPVGRRLPMPHLKKKDAKKLRKA